MSQPQACSSESELQALLDGTLPEERQAAIADHLETCQACRGRLDSLAGASGVIPVEIATGAEASRSEAFLEAMRKLKADDLDETVVASSAGPPLLRYLSPSANPRHLGRLGGYEILEVIGRGGMGTVLKARDAKLERLVAVKVLNPELASSGPARVRFLREARSAAAVTHEHVVTIHAVEDAGDVPFLVMEYILGVSLEDRIQRSGHLKVEEILRIGMQAASGLAAAHAQGLVHRDIKPSNILLENGVERVKITDFGLARVIHEAQLTQTNVAAGTPQYMSPEQARGTPVDHRSDLFSLGCVMYAMCVGRSPFRAETPSGAIHRVCEDTQRPIREVNPEVPDWLVAIIDRLLEKKPEDRYQTADEVAEVLGEYLAHVQQPSRVGLPSLAKRATAFHEPRSRSAWWKLAAPAVCLALVLIGVIAFLVFRNPSLPSAPEGYSFVDLREVANLYLGDPTDIPSNNLAELPTGPGTFAGVPFFVSEKYIHLGGPTRYSIALETLPQQVKHIRVGRRAHSLHFLHAIQGCGAKVGTTVARYTVHYDDGTSETFRVVYGEDLWDWYPIGGHDPDSLTRGQPAWSGSNERLREHARQRPDRLGANPKITIYRSEWVNRHPDKKIASLDYACDIAGAPFCVAITCQDAESTTSDGGKEGEGGGRHFFQADLQPFATRARQEPSHGDDVRNNLSELPETLQVAGVPFKIGARYIQLAGTESPGWPTAASGIAVNRKVAKLHFLHGCAKGLPYHGATVAAYTLHYDDGTSAELPVVTGRHLINWWLPDGTVTHATRAATAWIGHNPTAAEKGYRIQVFACAYENPFPNKVISTIDFRSGPVTWAYPFCLGITCDQNAEALPPEPGVAVVTIGRYSPKYSVSFPERPIAPVMASGQRTVQSCLLLPAGDHRIEVHLRGTLLRRGTVKITPGNRADISIGGGRPGLFPLPAPQPDPIAEFSVQSGGFEDLALTADGMAMATLAADGTVVLWKNDGAAWSLKETLDHGSDRIRSIAFSPDGRSLVTLAEGGALRLWDVKSGKPISTLNEVAPEGRDTKAYSVAISPKGDVIACGNGDGTVAFWSMQARKKIGTMEAHSTTVSDIAFSPDGSRMVTAAWEDNTVKVWDADSKRPLHVLYGHTEPVQAVLFSPDGSQVASASNDASVKLWSVETGKLLNSWTTPFELKALAFSPDGSRLAAGGAFHVIHVWDLTSKSLVHEFQAHWATIRGIAFADRGKALVSASSDNSIRLWSLDKLPGPFSTKTGGLQPRATFVPHDRWSYCGVFLSNGRNQLAAVSVAPNIRVWDLNNFTSVARFPVHVNEGADSFGWLAQRSLLFTPEGEVLVSCVTFNNQPPRIEQWETQHYKSVGRLEANPRTLESPRSWASASIVFAPNQERLILVSPQQNLVAAMNLTAGASESPWSTVSSYGVPTSTAVSHDGQILAVGTASGRVMMLDAATGKEGRAPLTHSGETVTSVAFAPQTTTLVSTGIDRAIKVWDLASSTNRVLPSIHGEPIVYAAFSPDGKLLATTAGISPNDEAPWNHNGEICIWEVATWKPLARCFAHYGCVTSAVFSPDSKSIATTGRDGKMHLWDVEELLKYGLGNAIPEKREAVSSLSNKAQEKEP
jgi:WD40 repeat protein/serine/threonine protein kinase